MSNMLSLKEKSPLVLIKHRIMKTYKGSGGIAPPIPSLGTGYHSSLPGKKVPLATTE
jgi:hypothetical protein